MEEDINNQSALQRWHGNQRRIGLTGGIASGKSSVGNFLAEVKALPILDTDIYAREVLAPGTSSTKAVFNRYGNSVMSLNSKNEVSLNRKALANIIFNQEKERLWLETLIHPLIKQRLNNVD